LIPKLIHQTCPDPARLPDELAENVAFLKANNPGWQHRLHGDEEVCDYLRDRLGPVAFSLLEKLSPGYGVVRADLFRYAVILEQGGVYLDIKSTCKPPLANILRDGDAFLLGQWQNRLGERYTGAGLYPELSRVPGGELQQWHVIGSPGHPFMAAVIDRVLFNLRNYHTSWCGVGKTGVLRLSGPICYTQTIYPMLGRHAWRPINALRAGLRYSIYEEQGRGASHMNAPDHYSKLQTPIMLA
jgi:mannosyltransferase OCH1-like enzyme